MIRAYQIKVNDQPGPWLAGMTLAPAEVRKRGATSAATSVSSRSFIARQPTLGIASAPLTWSAILMTVADMERVYDRYRGKTQIKIPDGSFRLE
jgi:hypothetical protein